MDPLLYLIPAIYTALSDTELTVAGKGVSVYQHPPEPQGWHYILITQPNAVDAGGLAGCLAWNCTVLIDVVTQFQGRAIDTIPSQQLAAQVLERLHRKTESDGTISRPRLALPNNWDCGPAELVLNQQLDEPAQPNKQLFAVRRLIRLRWPVYYHIPAAAPPEPTPGLLLLAFGFNGGALPRLNLS